MRADTFRRAFKKALRPGETRLVMLESPTNPRMQICDIRALVDISHEVCIPTKHSDHVV